MPIIRLMPPVGGLHLGVPYSLQPPDSTPDCLNYRIYDAVGQRARGGKRPGLSKAQPDPLSGWVQGLGFGRFQLAGTGTATIDTVTFDVVSGANAWWGTFINGVHQTFAKGRYQVRYVDGVGFSPAGSSSAYWYVYAPDTGQSWKMPVNAGTDGAALALENSISQAQYEALNAGANVVLDLTGPSRLYIHDDDPDYSGHTHGSPDPQFELTLMGTGGYVTKVWAVAAGKIYYGPLPGLATDDAVHLATDVRVQGAAHGQYVYFVDGTNYIKHSMVSGASVVWTPIKGALPFEGLDTATLACTWRGRIVLSGLKGDDQNWFMSRQDDPDDWAYGTVIADARMPVAGNNAPAGLVGDRIMQMIPASDDLLYFIGSRSVWLMRGDPAAGGQLDRVSDMVGGAPGCAWAKAPDGTIFFLGTDGVYVLKGGAPPLCLTLGRLDSVFQSLDLSVVQAVLVWDMHEHGLHLYLTGSSAVAADHYFWDERTRGWYRDRYFAAAGPTAGVALLGDTASDRRVLIGGWDGYIRLTDPAATSDDGHAIESRVDYPLLRLHPETLSLCTWVRTILVLDHDTTGVTLRGRVGRTAQSCQTADLLFSVACTGQDREKMVVRRGMGNAIQLSLYDLSADHRWACEEIAVDVDGVQLPRAEQKPPT
jgi:hypothetical protein